MKNIDQTIRLFGKFIESNWDYFQNCINISRKESLLSDLLQANWEILVESALCESNKYLDIYGDGADCNENSSRVFMPQVLPTYEIYCQEIEGRPAVDLLSGSEIEVKDKVFSKFVSWEGKQYSDAPPLKYVLLESDKDQFLVPLENVKFNLRHK